MSGICLPWKTRHNGLSPDQNSIPETPEYEVGAQTSERRRLLKQKEETRKRIDKGIKKRKVDMFYSLFSTTLLEFQKLLVYCFE
jgi:hypothetical protein